MELWLLFERIWPFFPDENYRQKRETGQKQKTITRNSGKPNSCLWYFYRKKNILSLPLSLSLFFFHFHLFFLFFLLSWNKHWNPVRFGIEWKFHSNSVETQKRMKKKRKESENIASLTFRIHLEYFLEHKTVQNTKSNKLFYFFLFLSFLKEKRFSFSR